MGFFDRPDVDRREEEINRLRGELDQRNKMSPFERVHHEIIGRSFTVEQARRLKDLLDIATHP